ncbi:isovaleryl-CoA dehydrogenase [Eoetvoesiella caeni]|uniref:Putative acyl-CoA dehydrogenase n=1 Tax=Eoetvoesiella caeni TaxID=645616 RepID=A0A366H644_9BURK|nr:isovaleryl-CoA dehydrogenase [Eoetvoesiella caeni]MCI2809953.1 isovaleryl-CoA dehydrogenase [Eoetvoesiella caeni]NYT55829.1 isovaleryl-CoA dehydrogenase [Eoetvoesiella caeni]RBP37560.1 putative acyl-CoA dehydrogenase [Eoetvoesiella caeni]
MEWATHEVSNQVPELVDYNLYSSDRILQEAVKREGASWHEAALASYGAVLGSKEILALAHEVNRHAPEAEPFDRWGRRVDRISFHPGWHQFLRMGFEQGMHSSAWSAPGPGAQVARAAVYLLHGQVEAGSLCPITMTSAALPLLQQEPWFEEVRPLLYSLQYDPTDGPLGAKRGMMVGMGMTEKQGGSDLRSNTTRALPIGAGGRGGAYRITGHKWFLSSPMSDAHLVLAGHEEQFSCFYVPRWHPEGRKNAVCIQRAKDKMGNRSNSSVEVEFQDAYGVLIGEAGRGIATLVEMAGYTRLDCVLGSTALLRQAVVQALHHAQHRSAFGRRLIEQPLMRAVLADLSLESEAATVLALRLARAFDAADTPLEQAFRRILTPASKFWVCKRTIEAAAECMEVWGGNGYIENCPMPRLYREAPVNSIWEGSGNVMCLDVLRALRREPEAAGALLDSLVRDCAGERLLEPAVQRLVELLGQEPEEIELRARYVAQQLVLLVQAGLMRRHSPPAVADAFIQSRFSGRGGRVYGVVSGKTATAAIFQRAWHE